MRDPRRWLRSLCGLSLVFSLALVCLAPAAAQVPEAGGLSLEADARGDARIDLWFEGSADPETFLKRIQGTLPCALENPQGTATGSIQVHGVCHGLFQRDGNLVRGRLDLGPLLQALKEPSFFNASVDLSAAAFHGCDGWTRNAFNCTESFYDEYGEEAVEIVYGFRASDLAWRFALPGALVLAPIPLLLRRRRRVLAAEGEARLNAWFGYWRAYRAIHLGNWLLWVVGVYALHLDAWTAFATPGTFTHQLLLLALLVVPPAAVFLIGHHLSQPVLAHVRELSRPRKEVRREALSYLLLAMVPLSCTLVGVGATRDNVSAAAIWLLAGFALVFVGRWVYARVTRLFPHALTLGDLRERVYELARRAGVRLQEIYILPASQRRMANAFATSGNHILLTDYLVAHLSRREVEAVVAHEMGHLRRRHTLMIPVALLAIYFGWTMASDFLGSLGAMAVSRLGLGRMAEAVGSVDLLPLFLLSGLLPLRFLLRRFERSADAQAAKLTGDPEALISALGKLARLSLLPLRWSWWTDTMSTHPSMIRRGEALARRFGVPHERMERLLRGEDTLDDGHFELPAATLSPDRVFTTLFKAGLGQTLLWTVIGVSVLSGVLSSWAVHQAGWGAGTFAVAFVGGGLVLQLLLNVLAASGYEDLGRRLAERLGREGFSVADGLFVGFAPDDSPRIYEGQGVWDVGFLVLGRDGLAFLGDQARFRLARGQVEAVRLGIGTPSWWRVGSVYVDWRSEEGSTRTFHLRGRGRTLWGLRRNTQDLAKRLASWLRSPEGGDLPELPPPPVMDVAGLHPRQALRLRYLVGTCYLIFVLCAVLILALQDWPGFLTAPAVGIGIYLTQVAPYLFAPRRGKDPKDVKDIKDLKTAA
jgi:STE24 endopeptidase